jgi:acylphosphatase
LTFFACFNVEVRLICRLCRVSGRVQGVYYRASARSQARELGITGYAANLSDGRVEVLACGEPEAVATFIDWLKIGPPAASVTGVEVLEHRPDMTPTRFETR